MNFPSPPYGPSNTPFDKDLVEIYRNDLTFRTKRTQSLFYFLDHAHCHVTDVNAPLGKDSTESSMFKAAIDILKYLVCVEPIILQKVYEYTIPNQIVNLMADTLLPFDVDAYKTLRDNRLAEAEEARKAAKKH